MNHTRLIDKVRRYDKYKETHAIDCGLDIRLAMYSGKRDVGDTIFVVTPTTYMQAIITERKGDLVKYQIAA